MTDAPTERCGFAGDRDDSVVRILQLTDCHFPAEAGRRIQGVDVERSFSAAVHSAFSSGCRFDLVLLTGDLADDPVASAYRRLRERLLPLRSDMPCYCLPGNHDDRIAMGDFLVGGNIRMSFRIQLANWQIVCLDSTISGRPDGQLDEGQLALLQQAIATEPDKHLLVAVHHHPVPCGSAWMDAMMIGNAERLIRILRPVRPQTRAVVFGHIHQALDRTHAGIRFLGSPSTCCQFKPNCAEFRLDSLPPGYRWLELRADGTLTTAVAYAAESEQV